MEDLPQPDSDILFRPRASCIPFEMDWRNHNGRNYVTPVKDQRQCGSCVSFATIGVVESMALIEQGLTLNLSEAAYTFALRTEQTLGWHTFSAFRQIGYRGVCDEAAFPYASAFTASGPVCRYIPDRPSRIYQIKKINEIQTMDDAKAYLSSVGPLAACFKVMTDFYTYNVGVYEYQMGDAEGWHCVQIIGYSDSGGFWICKNSWGPFFGESGYFKIAYGQCGIDGAFNRKYGDC